jgi:hypothetical protein
LDAESAGAVVAGAAAAGAAESAGAVVAGAVAAGAAESAGAVAAGAAVESAGAGVAGAVAAGAVSAAGAAAGAASSFLLHAARATANREAINSVFFMKFPSKIIIKSKIGAMNNYR